MIAVVIWDFASEAWIFGATKPRPDLAVVTVFWLFAEEKY